MAAEGFNVKLKLLENYVFELDFGDFGKVLSDEPEPLGQGEGPNPVRLLAAGVANCLCASLLFAVRKFKEDPGEISAVISGAPVRIDGRWRIEKLDVTIHLGTASASIPHLPRVLEQFEDFCVVTQSVREGIDVVVNVFDSNNEKLM